MPARPASRLALTWGLLAVLLLGVAACTDTAPDEAPPTADTMADGASAEARLYPVRQDGQWGYMDRTGVVVVSPRFDDAFGFSDGLALVRQDDRYGYIDRAGQLAIAPRFEDAWHFTDGRAPAKMDGQWGLIDAEGTMVETFDDSSGAFAGTPNLRVDPRVLVDREDTTGTPRRVRVDGQYGYRGADGAMTVEPRFDEAWYFVQGRARVLQDGQWGYIDPSGTFVVEPRFDRAWDFADGLALVQQGESYGYIDTSGAFVWAPTE